ncbi:protein LAZ12 [Sesamum angolense]|uniref:Protein LAZ12 n=1 Tax=Sesamum angolense TaxID=2727404 RepID=A0AAE1WEG2_9LAMI|nr:protein LAZ12 [Sesamum angolense]
MHGMDSPYLFLYQNTYKDLHLPAFLIAGCFGFAAIVLSLLLTFQHLRSYTNPSETYLVEGLYLDAYIFTWAYIHQEQKWIVAVLFMVPVYATESILSLWNAKLSLACDILRNCYEAFALYAFGSYLIACLGGERKVIDLLEDEARRQISKPLLEEKGSSMILKTLCAFLAFILELCGAYGEGNFKWYYGYPYITIVLNFSQMWALYCLVQFYNVTHRRLEPIKPLAKFISFKAIVFATWWQGVGIVLLCTFEVLPKEGKFQTGLQDFLICIEMAIAAVAHIFVFSAKPYHFIPAYHYGKITTQETKAMVKIEEGDEEKPALLEKRETVIKAPGTSVKESVQDIVVEGGQKVMEDVVLTINQAIEPVHEGMTKIQETFHHMSVSSDGKDEPEVNVEEVEQNITIKPED